MHNLALKIGDTQIDNPPGFKASEFHDLGSVLSGFLNVGFLLAGFFMLAWLFWGVFQYLLAGGNKESLAKARSRLIAAIVGFFIVVMAFAIAQFVEAIFTPKINGQPSKTVWLVQPVYAQGADLSKEFGFGYFSNLGEFLQQFEEPAFSIAAVLVVVYFIVAAFRLLTSAGDKNAVAGAREMITHAIVAFLMLMVLFLVLQYLPEAIGLKGYRIIK